MSKKLAIIKYAKKLSKLSINELFILLGKEVSKIEKKKKNVKKTRSTVNSK